MVLRCMVVVWFICFVVCGVWVGCDVLLFGLSGWLCRFWAGFAFRCLVGGGLAG